MRSRQRGGKRMEEKFPEGHVALSHAADCQGREGLSTHLIAVLSGSLGAKHVHQLPQVFFTYEMHGLHPRHTESQLLGHMTWRQL